MLERTIEAPCQRIWKDLKRDLHSRAIAIPDFQREYVWDVRKARRFVERSLRDRYLLNPIHLVRVANGPLLLLDGRQRTDTLCFAKYDPQHLGVSETQVESLNQISVQVFEHRVAKEFDAIQLFRDINQSTGLIAYELFRPYLDCEPDLEGDDWYERTRTAYLGVLRTHSNIPTNEFDTKYRNSRKQFGQYARGALAVFHKWHTRHVKEELYKSADSVSEEDLIETVVLGHLLAMGKAKREQRRKDFISALESSCADIQQICVGKDYRRIMPIVLVVLSALKFHMQASGYTVAEWHRVIQWYKDQMTSRSTLNGSFDVELSDDVVSFRFSNTSLSAFLSSLKRCGLDFKDRKRRRKQTPRAPGFDDGHPDDKPFATHGDEGTNTAELRSKNRGKR